MEMNLLFKKVLENPLILETIFDQLCQEDLFQLRQVCQIWKNTINLVMRRTYQLDIIDIFVDKENCVIKLISDLEYFVSLNLRRICFTWSNEITKNLAVAIHLKGVGNLVNDLSIKELNLENEGDFIALETIINSMPNLEKLDIELTQINIPLFCKFNPNFKIKLVKINASWLDDNDEHAETIVTETLRIFGNPSANFDHSHLDRYLFTFLSKRKEPLVSLQKMEFKNTFDPDLFCIPKTVNSSILPNLKKLCFDTAIIALSKSFITSLESCLKQFAKSLETVDLQFSEEPEDEFTPVVITVPPLPKLRSLTLGTPPIIFNDEPAFLWDLGKQLSKDFPVLEKLKLQKKVSGDELYDSRLYWEDYNYPEACCIWEAFIPILGKESVDLSSFKTMKEVSFDLPLAWLSNAENIPWAKSFLEVCYKLFPVSNLYYSKEIEMLEILTGMPKSFTRP